MSGETPTEVKTQYPPPVDKLLSIGDPRQTKVRLDYSAMGLGPENIPDLIRMATDEELNTALSDTREVWAPLHAWRALGQFRAEAAIEPLLGLYRRVGAEDDDWVLDDLPRTFGMIGPSALPALSAFMADKTYGQFTRTSAAHAIREIAQQHPESRNDCVAALSCQLEQFEENNESFNGSLIAFLLDLNAVEAAPVMEKAFAAGRVDLIVAGDWEDVQIALGLRKERETPRPDPFAGLRQKLELFRQTRAASSGSFVDLRAINKAQKQARSQAKKAKKALMLKRQRRK